ncbi:MAG: transglutaminase domain-containing protein [Burkholderiaceae bacterium]|nr:transglutaminase domain-containing protein [Microbacteriaceae bacterium]
MSVRSSVSHTLFVWASVAVAASALWPVYESLAFVVMVVGATTVATVLAICGAVYRWRAHTVALSLVTAFLLLGVPLAVPGRAALGVLPTPAGELDLVVAAVTGWKQLVTISLPVGAFEALLVPAFILVLATVSLSLGIALRSRRAELAVLPPVALFLVGAWLGSTAGFHPAASAIALLVVLLAWVAMSGAERRNSLRAADVGTLAVSRADRRRRAVRSTLGTATVLAIAAASAVAFGATAAPTAPREVLRSSVEQRFDSRDYTSPLSGFRRYHQDPRENGTMLTLEGLPDGARIRIATLDSYDGTVYSVGAHSIDAADARPGSTSGSFTLVPTRVDQSAVDGTAASVSVTVGDYSGVWVPTVGALAGIEFDGPDSAALRGDFYYDTGSGTAANLAGISPSDRYVLDAVIPRDPTAAELASLVPASAPASEMVPDGVAVRLDGWVRGSASAGSAGARLQAAIAGLRADGYVSHGTSDDEPASRSGHSANRITELLTSAQMIGDGEQYAVAAAIMARELGFPSRVVMGFTPEVTPGAATVVTGADISAWIEVNTVGLGWVAMDPTPPPGAVPEPEVETPTAAARPQAATPPPPEEAEPQVPADARDLARDDLPSDDSAAAAWLLAATVVGVAGATVALVLLPFLLVIAAKLRRRGLRRTAASTRGRIDGAWREFTDVALDHGVSSPPSATRSEFASAVGGAQPLLLAAATDRAAFAPAGPTAAEADRAWNAVDEYRLRLDRALTRRERWRGRVSLRSLRPARAFAAPGRSR